MASFVTRIQCENRYPFKSSLYKQLSYRKEIARQLRTQYVNDIYSPLTT